MSRRNLRSGASARSGYSGGAREVGTIPMQVDLRVHDDVALGEIELYADVLTAVAASDGPLSQGELDVALGLGRPCGCAASPSSLGTPCTCQ
jgi:hypothetical protein